MNFFLLLVVLLLSSGTPAFADIAPPSKRTTNPVARQAVPRKPTLAKKKTAKSTAAANDNKAALKPVSSTGTTPTKKGFDLSALKKKLNGIVKRWNLPGIGVVVVNREKVLFAGGFGFANKEKKTPITKDTQFRIGSVTKSFIALAVLKLVEEGRLKLSDKVKDLVPKVQFTNPFAKTHPLRVVHLLEHTSGFDDMHFDELYHRKKDIQPLSVSLAVNPRSRRIRWKPGTYVAYSNPGYTVAGAIVEKVSGKPLHLYIKDTILKPMGITVGDFYRTALIKQRLAQGYKGKPKVDWNKALGGKGKKKSKAKKRAAKGTTSTKKSKVAPRTKATNKAKAKKTKAANKTKVSKKKDKTKMLTLKVSKQDYLNIYHWPAGSLHLSPLEMGRFLQFLLRRGRSVIKDQRLLKKASILRMETPTSAMHVRKGLKVGYGLGNYSSFENGYPSQGHNGGIDGFITTARYLPKQGVGFAVMLHCSGFGKPLGEAQKAIAKALLAHLPRPKAPSFKMTPAQLRSFAGKYQVNYMRNQVFSFLRSFAWLRIQAEKDHLTMQRLGFVVWSKKKQKLYPTSASTFRFKKHLGPSIGFGKDKQGRMLMFVQGIGGTLVRDGGLHPQVTWLLLLLWLLLSAATGLFTLVWISLKIFGGLKESRVLRLRVYPFLSLLSLVGAVFILQGRSLEVMGSRNFFTMGFFVLSMLFATFTIYSVGVLIRSFKMDGIHLAVRLWATAAIAANVGMMIYLWPVIGLRFWSF
jgi:CubicO group peptidase (beta-lactamase class C family)